MGMVGWISVAQSTEWQGAMVIQLGGLRDANPPYDEGGCLTIGGIGCRAGLIFYGEFIGEAVGYVGAAY
jgi:hypothetical protein